MPALPTYVNKKDAIVRKIHAALERERAENEHSTGLRLSAIGGCVRYLHAVQHGRHNPPPPTADVLAIFDSGRAHEDLVVRWLELAEMPVYDRQETAVMELDADTAVVGHIDGVVDYDGVPHLLEVKSAKASQFAEFKKRGYAAWKPEYGDQLQAYLNATGLEAALVAVICKDTSELAIEKIRADPDRYEVLKSKARQILDGGKVPERPFASQFGAPCRFCSANSDCFGPAWESKFDE